MNEKPEFAERLQRLEKQNRRLMVAMTLLGVLVVALLSLGAAPNLDPVADVVAARQFELIDTEGNLRGLFTVDEEGSTKFLLGDDQGWTRASIRIVDGGVTLQLFDENALSCAELCVDDESSAKLLLSTPMEESIETRAALGVLPEGLGYLRLYDELDECYFSQPSNLEE